MGTHHRVIEHHVGQTGAVSLRVVSGTVRVRGTDSEEARVEATYDPGRTPDPDRSIEVTQGEGELRIEARGDRGSLRGLSLGGTPDVDLEVTVPRAAALTITSVSAAVQVVDLGGVQAYRTVSGDLSAADVSGSVTAQSVSGDLRVAAESSVALEATSTSGDIKVAAERLERAKVRTVSGDVSIAAEAWGAAPHAVETVSGSLRLATGSGLTLRANTFSGDIRAERAHRSEARGFQRIVVVGDGTATLEFRSMSGDVHVSGPDGVPPSGSAQPAEPPTPPRPLEPPRPIDPPRPPLPPAAPRPHTTGEASLDDELTILRALERGEIDVEEATRRLEVSR
jgi:hypothetical protein